MGVLMSIVMVCVYLVTSIFAGKENLIEITGESSVVSFSLMTALNFVAGILVLLQGVRMFGNLSKVPNISLIEPVLGGASRNHRPR